MLRVGRSNVQRFRGGLVFKAQILCGAFNSRLESNKEEKKKSVNTREAELDPPLSGEGRCDEGVEQGWTAAVKGLEFRV